MLYSLYDFRCALRYTLWRQADVLDRPGSCKNRKGAIRSWAVCSRQRSLRGEVREEGWPGELRVSPVKRTPCGISG